MNDKTIIRAAAAVLLASFLILSACAAGTSTARRHPEEVTGVPRCSDCHDDAYTVFDHKAGYNLKHKYHAAESRLVCAACHKQSFCADCHADKEELKPSDKFKNAPERDMPHRGNYLARHKIDGRINPSPCFRCHGRRNDRRCRQCHK